MDGYGTFILTGWSIQLKAVIQRGPVSRKSIQIIMIKHILYIHTKRYKENYKLYTYKKIGKKTIYKYRRKINMNIYIYITLIINT
jgi:hypothetical protein